MDLLKMLQEAIHRVEIRTNTVDSFEVKDLFNGDEWGKLERQEKQQFGALFSKEQREGRIPALIRCENGKNRHNKYRKV